MKKPKYTCTFIYINIHKLNFYSVLSDNHILHLNYVFDELLHTSIRLRIILLTYIKALASARSSEKRRKKFRKKIRKNICFCRLRAKSRI